MGTRFRTLAVVLLPVGLILGRGVMRHFRSLRLLWCVFLFLLRKKRIYNLKNVISTVCISAVLASPFAYMILFYPDFTNRVRSISAFAQSTTFGSAINSVLANFARITFSPDFLFVLGDSTRRHSIGVFGMLLSVSVVPLFILVTKLLARKLPHQLKLPLKFSALGIATTNLMCATTSEGQPHSLRSALSWVF
ncbi:MAG: hypothetical protein LBP35_07000 [Candidatus Ancillula trichonymphae]|jgi:hypothetical protein|nr:hypothetical protein [Candidatus Ancillula trichonymphae]